MSGSLETDRVLSSRIQLTEVLSRLRLTAGKAAQVCGVTRRQLCYWTDKGIIPCCNDGGARGASRRIYDFHGLRKALMLKRLMDEGRGLRRAVRELRTRWAEPAAADEPAVSDEHALLAQAARLAKLGDHVRELSAHVQRRQALVRLALALRPLAELSQAACDGRVSFTGDNRIGTLGSLLSEAERTARQVR